MSEEAVAYDTESTPEQIEQASSQGWKDDPEHPKYKTAAEFLEAGEQIAPIASKQNKRLEAEITRIKETHTKEMGELRGAIFTQERKGYERAVNELNVRKEKAFENEDVDALREIDTEAQKLEAPPAPPPEPEPDRTEFEDWRKEETWYMNTISPDDMAKTAYADAILERVKGEVMAANGARTTNKDVFDAVTREVKEHFKVNKAPAVEIDGEKPPKRTGKKDWRSLPKWVKDQATDGDYVNKYFEGDKEEYAKKAYETMDELQGE